MSLLLRHVGAAWCACPGSANQDYLDRNGIKTLYGEQYTKFLSSGAAKARRSGGVGHGEGVRSRQSVCGQERLGLICFVPGYCSDFLGVVMW